MKLCIIDFMYLCLNFVYKYLLNSRTCVIYLIFEIMYLLLPFMCSASVIKRSVLVSIYIYNYIRDSFCKKGDKVKKIDLEKKAIIN